MRCRGELLTQALAPTTRVRYERGLQEWIRFLKTYPKVYSLQFNLTLELFVTWRLRGGARPSSVYADLAAIRHQCAVLGREYVPTEASLGIKALIKGGKRVYGGGVSKKALPFKWLARFCRHLHSKHGNQRDVWLTIATLIVAFFGMLRVSEYAGKASEGDAVFTWNRVRILETATAPASLTILRTKSKTNQVSSREETTAIHCTCSLELCAVHALKHFRHFCERTPGSARVCAFNDGSPVQPWHVSNWVKACAELAGGARSDYSSHSLRSGGATHYFVNGVSLDDVAKLGRWAPGSTALRNSYLQATQQSAAGRAAAALQSHGTL